MSGNTNSSLMPVVIGGCAALSLLWYFTSKKGTPKQTTADKRESEILRVLCKRGTSLSLTALNKALTQELGWTDESDVTLRQFLTTRSPHNTKLFHLEENLVQNECTVRVKTDVAVVCTSYNARLNTCEEGSNCKAIHICIHFIFGKCERDKSCVWPHQLQSPHNDAILLENGLKELEDEYVLQILRHSSVGITVPVVRNHDDNVLLRSPAKSADQICIFNLRGKCAFGNRCSGLHTQQHYQWQYSADNGQTWTNFDDNVAIEKLYCDLTVESVNFRDVTIRPLCFETMKWSSMAVRRLEIQLTNTSETNSWQSVLATKWQWYFLDNGNIWVQYTNNDEAEEAYQQFLSTGQEPKFEFGKVRSHRYELHFPSMMQTNKLFGTKRKVRRRPKFVNEDMRERCLKKMKMPDMIFPKYWETYLEPADSQSNFVRRKLDPRLHEEEYRMVIGHFAQEMDVSSILAIERVQNIELWREFSLRRDHMQNGQEDSSKAPAELMLFHGTKNLFIEAMCQQNFDPRVSGSRVGTKHGQGSYFSKSAKYSDAYASADSNGQGHMFLVRVLVGSYTLGDPKYRRPPKRDTSKRHGPLFDSCVDNLINPKIFVIFDRNQVYPEYLITYKK